MPEESICFITCVNDEKIYGESRLYAEHLHTDLPVEFIPVRGASSMAAGYNWAMRQSRARYKIYLHQDVLIVEKNCIKMLCELFLKYRQLAMLGVIGAETLPPSGVWWGSGKNYGRVLHAAEPESISPSVCLPVNEWKAVEALDGLFLATQRDLPWREDLFDGWHFYDVSQCMEFKRQGYQTAIPEQTSDWCLHLTRQKPLDASYWKYQQIFLREYEDDMESHR